MIEIIKMIENFNLPELACPCCGKVQMHEELLLKLDDAREKANIPFKITSGYRCKKHNAEVGGKENSEHCWGKAVDIAVSGSRQRFIVVSALMLAGFSRIGIAKNFVHADVSPSKGDCVIWLYN